MKDKFFSSPLLIVNKPSVLAKSFFKGLLRSASKVEV